MISIVYNNSLRWKIKPKNKMNSSLLIFMQKVIDKVLYDDYQINPINLPYIQK